MKKLILIGFTFCISYKGISQTYVPVTVSGYSADVIAEGSGSAALSTTQAVDIANFSLVALNFVNPSNQSPTTALPNNGLINSAATPGLSFQLAPYSANNSLRIPASGTGTGTGTGTLTLSTPVAADNVYILGFSGNGISTVTVTVTFTDATTQVFTAQTFNDWFGGTGFAIQGIGRVNRSTNAIENPAGDPRIYQKELILSTGNKTKLIQSIAFNKTSTTGVLNIMGVSIKSALPPTPNDLGISAITGLTTGCGLTNQETITVTINNTGSAAQANFPVTYQVNSLPVVSETYTNSIAPGASATYTFNTKANLSTAGTYSIMAKTMLTGDANTANDATTISAINSVLPSLPATLDFETPATGLSVFRKVVNTRSNIVEGTGASNGTSSTKGMIMDGVNSTAWVIPAAADPFLINTTNIATAKICVNPAGGNPNDPLWLSFDLKQLYKGNSANTNFRITLNGLQVGNVYQPASAASTWQRININMTALKTQPNIEISFESSVKEEYASGTGTANLIDNIRVLRSSPLGTINKALEDQFSIYPNPSTGIFTVSLPTAGYSVEVLDLTGRLIKKQSLTVNENQLDLSAAGNGIYLMKISDQNKTVIRKIVIE